MIQLVQVMKQYSNKNSPTVTALKDVNLSFGKKGMVFILGKSGSGKTTLLNVIGGLDQPTQGQMFIEGKPTTSFTPRDWNAYRNTIVGFVFQDHNLIEAFTVRKNIALAIELQGRKPTEHEIDDVLKQVDLEHYGDRYPSELSTGQKQRIAIARALIKESKIILADEPTGSLDSKTGKTIFNILKKIAREKLVIVVTHDRSFAETYGDRIIELKDGAVIRDEVLKSPSEADELTKEQEIILKRAHFPLKYAFPLAFNVLRHKPFRLFFIILLSTIAFLLISLVVSASDFDQDRILLETIYHSDNRVITLYHDELSEETFLQLSQALPDYIFQPLIEKPSSSFNHHLVAYVDSEIYSKVYKAMIMGSMEMTEEILEKYKLKIIAGRLPRKNEEDNEIAISEYIYKHFEHYGYYWDKEEDIKTPQDIIGKQLRLNNRIYTIVGVIDTNFDLNRYQILLDDPGLENYKTRILYQEFSQAIYAGIHALIYVREGYIEENDWQNSYTMVTTHLSSNLNKDLEFLRVCQQFKFSIESHLVSLLEDTNEILFYASKIFSGLTLFMAIFYAILLVNYILKSVVFKKKEIGILRAIGASKIDIFSIFMVEGFLIAGISIIIGFIALIFALYYVNDYIINQLGFPFVIFYLRLSKVFLIVVLNLLVTSLATFFPLHYYAKKHPIDVIRSL